MKMKKTLFLVALLGLFLLPLQGKAAISVIDFSNLKQNITTSLNMVKSVAQQITMISNQVKQYEAMLQSLKSFDSQTYNQLRILLQGGFPCPGRPNDQGMTDITDMQVQPEWCRTGG